MTKKIIHLELIMPQNSLDINCDDYSFNDNWLCIHGDGLLSYYNISNIIAFHVSSKETELR